MLQLGVPQHYYFCQPPNNFTFHSWVVGLFPAAWILQFKAALEIYISWYNIKDNCTSTDCWPERKADCYLVDNLLSRVLDGMKRSRPVIKKKLPRPGGRAGRPRVHVLAEVPLRLKSLKSHWRWLVIFDWKISELSQTVKYRYLEADKKTFRDVKNAAKQHRSRKQQWHWRR